jgi:hypothetical protein
LQAPAAAGYGSQIHAAQLGDTELNHLVCGLVCIGMHLVSSVALGCSKCISKQLLQEQHPESIREGQLHPESLNCIIIYLQRAVFTTMQR